MFYYQFYDLCVPFALFINNVNTYLCLSECFYHLSYFSFSLKSDNQQTDVIPINITFINGNLIVYLYLDYFNVFVLMINNSSSFVVYKHVNYFSIFHFTSNVERCFSFMFTLVFVSLII